MFIPQLATTGANVLWTSRDISVEFSDFTSNGWVIHFSPSDIDAGLLVFLAYGLQIHLQFFLSDIDVGLTVSLLYILQISLFICTRSSL